MASSSKFLTDAELEAILNDDKFYADDETVSETEDNLEEDDVQDDDFVSPDVENGSSSDEDELPRKIVYGKKGYKWNTNPIQKKNSRISKINIVTQKPGPKGNALQVTNERESWSVFFNANIIDKIITHTNEEIKKQCIKYKNQLIVHQTDKIEIESLIGLLYYTAVLGNSHVNIEVLWSKDLGNPIYKATMSRNRFQFLLNCLRFDDKSTREERRATDKFAPIRYIWDVYISNCRNAYSPSEFVTVDEQLLGFRGKCPFKMYIPNKPDKYGIKIVMMCDAKSNYMITGVPYVGKEERVSTESIPTQYVLQLTEPIHGTNRNVTMDNWFTSVPLAIKLLDEYKLTLVGTLRKNKVEIPPSFLQTKGRQPQSSKFGFDERITLLSWSQKKGKNTILISTMHNDKSIDAVTRKPEIVLFYNSTKSGVDTFDQMCHSSTVTRKTRRWPMRVFYGMLDGSAINAYTIFKQVCKSSISRTNFLKNLGNQLVTPCLKRRLLKTNMPIALKMTIRDVLGQDYIEPNQSQYQNNGGRCSICPRSKNRKGRNNCVKCNCNLCAEHRVVICKNCCNS